MRVVVTGGTGFIGRALCADLVKDGGDVVVLSRNPAKKAHVLPDGVEAVEWDGRTAEGWARHADGAHAIVNLAGENIASGLWTRARKRAILESRVNAGRAVTEAIRKAQTKPAVLVQGSAVGYYGSCGDEELTESAPAGDGFLAEVTRDWEASTQTVEPMGVRRVIIRTGIVLGWEGGVLRRMALPFTLFFGGHLGSGDQWYPWIHIDDEIGAIRFLMNRGDLSGVFNLTAPAPERMRPLCRLLGRVMRRPSWFPMPGFVLRFLAGELGDQVLLSGQRALPKQLLEAGYTFRHADLESALRDIVA